jgi:hypothetical protein
MWGRWLDMPNEGPPGTRQTAAAVRRHTPRRGARVWGMGKARARRRTQGCAGPGASRTTNRSGGTKAHTALRRAGVGHGQGASPAAHAMVRGVRRKPNNKPRRSYAPRGDTPRRGGPSASRTTGDRTYRTAAHATGAGAAQRQRRARQVRVLGVRATAYAGRNPRDSGRNTSARGAHRARARETPQVEFAPRLVCRATRRTAQRHAAWPRARYSACSAHTVRVLGVHTTACAGRNPRDSGRNTSARGAHRARARETPQVEFAPRLVCRATRRTAQRHAAWLRARHSASSVYTVRVLGVHTAACAGRDPHDSGRNTPTRRCTRRARGKLRRSSLCRGWLATRRGAPHGGARHGGMHGTVPAACTRCACSGRTQRCAMPGATHATAGATRRRTGRTGRARGNSAGRFCSAAGLPHDAAHRTVAHGMAACTVQCPQRAHGARARGAHSGVRSWGRPTRQLARARKPLQVKFARRLACHATRRTARRRTTWRHALHSARSLHTVRVLVAHTTVRDTWREPRGSGHSASMYWAHAERGEFANKL